MVRGSVTNTSSKKRKACDSIVSSPTLSSSLRLKKTKITNDEENNIRETLHINLSKEFNRISINSPGPILRSSSNKAAASQISSNTGSARKNTRNLKVKGIIETEEEKNEDDDDDNVSCASEQTTVTRRTRSASRTTRTKSALSEEPKDYSSVSE